MSDEYGRLLEAKSPVLFRLEADNARLRDELVTQEEAVLAYDAFVTTMVKMSRNNTSIPAWFIRVGVQELRSIVDGEVDGG
jgi:hypothetical protein